MWERSSQFCNHFEEVVQTNLRSLAHILWNIVVEAFCAVIERPALVSDIGKAGNKQGSTTPAFTC